MNKKYVLIIGSCGYIGHSLVQYILNNTEYYVIGVDSLQLSNRNINLYNLQKCGITNFDFSYNTKFISENNRYIFYYMNAYDKCFEDIVNLYNTQIIASVISIYNDTSYMYDNISETYNNLALYNINSVLWASSVLCEHLTSHIIYLSSQCIFQNNDEIYINENTLPNKESLSYFINNSIYANENFLKMLTYIEKNDTKITICRFNDVYGNIEYNNQSTVMQLFDMIKNDSNDISQIYNVDINITYIDTLCNRICNIINNKHDNKFEIYNINDKNNISIYDIINIIYELLNINKINSTDVITQQTYDTTKYIQQYDDINEHTEDYIKSAYEYYVYNSQKLYEFINTHNIEKPVITSHMLMLPSNTTLKNKTYVNYNSEPVCIYHSQGMKHSTLCYDTYKICMNNKLTLPDDITILTTYTDENLCYIYKQCKLNNIEIINSYNEEYGKFHRTLKIDYIINALKNIKTKYVIILDGYDVILNSFDNIIEKFKSYNTRILFNASKNNYPQTYIDSIECRDYMGDFRYFNAGCLIGYTDDVIDFYTQAKQLDEEIYAKNVENSEQYILRHVFKKYSQHAYNIDVNKFVAIDYLCRVFICLGNSDFIVCNETNDTITYKVV